MRTHAFCMRTHTQSIRTHIIGLCMQALCMLKAQICAKTQELVQTLKKKKKKKITARLLLL